MLSRQLFYVFMFGLLCVGTVKVLSSDALQNYLAGDGTPQMAETGRPDGESPETSRQEPPRERPSDAHHDPLEDGSLMSLRTPQARELRLEKSRDGHFYAALEINRTPITMLVDTGASAVALRDSDAAAAGIYAMAADFKWRVNTANGQVLAARMTAREIVLGDITLRDREVFILPDDKLHKSLLGMNVLSAAGRIEISADELVIKPAS